MKWPKLKRDYSGAKVRTLRDLKNGWCSVQAGTVMTVSNWSGGLFLWGEPCGCCGVRVSMSKVPLSDVELIELPSQIEVSK